MGSLHRIWDRELLNDGSVEAPAAIDSRSSALEKAVLDLVGRGWFPGSAPLLEMEANLLLEHLFRRRSPDCWNADACRRAQKIIEKRMNSSRKDNDGFESFVVNDVWRRDREGRNLHIVSRALLREPIWAFIRAVCVAYEENDGRLPVWRASGLRASFVGCLYESAPGTALSEVKPKLRVVSSKPATNSNGPRRR